VLTPYLYILRTPLNEHMTSRQYINRVNHSLWLLGAGHCGMVLWVNTIKYPPLRRLLLYFSRECKFLHEILRTVKQSNIHFITKFR